MKRKFYLIFLVVIFILSIISLVMFSTFNHQIKLNGNKYITIGLNEEYKELGAVNSFNDNKYITISGEVDNTKVGTYKVSYVTKLFGISMKKYRYVKVVDKDSPIIELEGDSEIVLCPKEEFNEIGYKAYDSYDGDLTSSVEISKKDDVITYNVKDKSNNSFSINRFIKREDKEKPVIKLKGYSSYNLIIGDSFKDPGYTVSDNCSEKVEVKVDGSVDTSKEGKYTITYTATDDLGNASTVKRYISVNEKDLNNTGVIYLTFDDGPSSSSTPKVLDILKKKGVQATFFVINHGDGLDHLIKRAYDEGHTIALHSYTHSYSNVYSSVENYFEDLQKISDKVEKITGEKSMIMRFPGGASNTVSRKYKKGIMTTLTKEVLDRGYHYFDWNVSSGDAGGAKNSKDVYNNVIKGLKKNRSNVVLMHDFSNSKSVAALEDIIDYGLANGYRFDKIDMTTPMVRHGVNN